MNISSDQHAMQIALEWAAKGMNTTMPNPRVGCILVRDQKIIGAGYTQPAGQAHAEIHALQNAQAQGHDTRGATAYVTLEPCSHVGRTPPCVDALIQAGIKRVVAAIGDPNPQVAGKGLQRLQQAGIEVTCPVLETVAHEMNIGFFKRMQTGRPWVRMKIAASLDGKTALHNHQSQWITGTQAREDGHDWRARACGILTGIGTVLADDPQLTVRSINRTSNSTRQPLRIIVDSQLHTPPGARILDPGSGGALIVHAVRNPEQEARLTHAGVQLLFLPNVHEKVDLPALMFELGRREMNELHVEAGFKLNGALIREHCTDELLLYLAPGLLGDACGMMDLPALDNLAQQTRLRFHQIQPIGEDVRILARFHPT